MIRRPIHIALALAPLAALCGCADGRTASTTSETENVVTARELLVDSILPSWITRDSDPGVAILRLDGTHLPISSTDSVARDLAFAGIDGNPMPFEVVSWDRELGRGRVRLRIDDPARMQGHRVQMLWKQPLAQRGDAAAVWWGIAPERRTLLASLVLDDFEDGDLASALPSGASWFVDAPRDSTSVEPPRIDADSTSGTGLAMTVDFVADRSKFRYVVAGLGLSSFRPFSFRGLDSLTLDVCGPTRLTVQLEHLGGGDTRKAWVHHDLDSGWRHLRILPGDFLPADTAFPSVVGWKEVRDSIDALTFLLSGGNRVRFDNIRLHGVNRDDLR